MTAAISAHGFQGTGPGEPTKKPMSTRTVKQRLKEAREIKDLPDAYSDAVAMIAAELTTKEATRLAVKFAGGEFYPVMADVHAAALAADEGAGAVDDMGLWRPNTSEPEGGLRELTEEERPYHSLFQ